MNTSSSINKSYQSLDSSTIDRWAKTRPGFNKPKIEKLTSKDIQKSILNATRKSPPRRRKNVRFTNSSSMDDTSTSSTVEVQESEEESASVASQEEDQKVSLNLYHNISEMRSFLCDFPEPEVFATADVPFGSESSSNNSPTNSCHSNEVENTTSNIQPCTKLPEKKRSTTSSSTLALLTGKKLRLKDIVLETKKSKVEERKTVQPQIQKPIKKPERPRELDLIEELRKINAQIEKDRQEALQNRQILNTSSTDTQTSPPISSSVATQIEQILFPAMTHSSAPEPITYPESVSDVETEPEPRSATEIPLATEPDYYQTDVLACRQEISDYPFLSTTVKDSSEMTLSEAKHKIFTVFEEISSGHNSLRSRDKLLFTYKRPLVQEEDDLSVLKSIPIRSWDQCMKALTRIRLKRLSEIRHVVQEEREVIFTRSKIAELYTRAVTLRTKIKEERKKSFELLKRNNRRAKLGSKKPGPSKQLKKPATLLAGKSATTYQGTILDNHMSKLLAKMFFILLRNKLHVRRVTTDLIVRMEDESYEHLARSTLHILSYNRLKKKVLGNLLETCQRKSNRIKRRALFFMWRQAAADKHQQSYNERKATEYRNRLLLKRAFNTFVYGCLSNSLNNLGTAIARVWFEIKLLSRCYYGWRKIVTQEAYLRKGLCSLVFSDEQDDALNDLDSQVESYWQFRTKIIIKQKIHNDWTEQYKCLKEIAEHRRCYQMLDIRDQLRPQFYGQIFAHMPSESDDEVEVEERRNHDVQRAKVVKEKALVNSCKKKKKENQVNIQHAERSFYERISQSTLYEAADQVYKMKLLRRFFVSWCSQYHTVTLTRLAQKHYGEVVLRKSFVTLRQYRKRNDPEYIARNICRQVLIERCFKTWHQAYAMKTVRCLALSDRFRYESLLSKAFQGLRYYALFCKKQKADAEKIAAFRRKVTLNRAFKGLLLHLVERRIRQRLLDIARKHYEERLLRKSLATITLYSRRQSLINKIVGEAVEKRRKSQSIEDSNLLRKVVRVWYRMTQRANKRRQMLIMQYTAGVFYTKTMKRAAFATWCNRYKQALKLRMVYLQNLGIVRRVFIKWRDLVKERRRNHPQQPQPDLPKTQPETAPPKQKEHKPRPKLPPRDITTTTPKPAAEHKTEHNKQGEENVKRKVFFIWREKYYENKIVAYFKKKRAMNALKHYAFNFSRITPLEFLMKRFFDRWRASASKRRSVGSESKSPSSSAVKQQ